MIHTPYATLTPDLILSAIESIGFICSGNLLALNSYENRVYQIGLEDNVPIVAKFYRPERWTTEAILEEHAFALELTEHEIPVIAPLIINGKTLHVYENFRFAVFPRRGGRALEVDNLDQLEWMGRFLGRLHAVGAVRNFNHRLHLNVETYGYQPYQFLLEQQFIPSYMLHNYQRVVDSLLEIVLDCFKQVPSVKSIRLHGDCHAGNVLWNDAGPHIVDLDDALMGPPIQDIWMLLTGNREQQAIELDCILEGYTEFHEFNFREIQLIEGLRTLRMIYYSGWLAKRWQDPAFPLSFPWFNTPRYWEEQLKYLSDQLILLQD